MSVEGRMCNAQIEQMLTINPAQGNEFNNGNEVDRICCTVVIKKFNNIDASLQVINMQENQEVRWATMKDKNVAMIDLPECTLANPQWTPKSK